MTVKINYVKAAERITNPEICFADSGVDTYWQLASHSQGATECVESVQDKQ